MSEKARVPTPDGRLEQNERGPRLPVSPLSLAATVALTLGPAMTHANEVEGGPQSAETVAAASFVEKFTCSPVIRLPKLALFSEVSVTRK